MSQFAIVLNNGSNVTMNMIDLDPAIRVLTAFLVRVENCNARILSLAGKALLIKCIDMKR